MQRLELTWIGKGEEPEVEPRILIHDPSMDYGDPDTGNMLIHGDNLLALKALEQDYAGKMKCIYIDPPYNTGAAFEYYDDNLEHSIWLDLMKPRLEILRSLLADDGLLFVQIDDNEQAYLTILLDEIFGRKNRLNTITVKMSEASGVKMAHADKRLPKLKEYILVYYKAQPPLITPEKVPLQEWNNEYKQLLTGISDDEIDELHNILHSSEGATEATLNRCNSILSRGKVVSLAKHFKGLGLPKEEEESWKFAHAKYIIQAVGSTSVFKIAKNTHLLDQDVMAVPSSSGLIYLVNTRVDMNAKQPRVQVIFASDNLSQNQGDLWLDIKTTGGVGQEGGVLFANSKKPERLIKKVISLCTNEGDFVLDSFLGSGTTAAVAQKMNRRWIGIELGGHAYTHCIPRLKKVIDGNDETGITDLVSWRGGGGYRFFELAPSLIAIDSRGNPVFSEQYSPEMLVAAVTKLNGFRYAPDPDVFWKQGYSQDKSYIYVTTQYLTAGMLDGIASDMDPLESLLVCAPAFDLDLNKRYDNITVKKIPQSVLAKCEYGVDNYNLNIVDLPVCDDEEREDD